MNGLLRPAMVLLTFLVPMSHAQDLSPQQVRAAFKALLDRPKVDLDPKSISTREEGGMTIETVDFASEVHADGTIERVPTLIVRPNPSEVKRPAVIVLHGTGGNKESQLSFMRDLAAQGIIGVAIDARFHGARSGGAKGAAAYLAAITRAWRSKPGEPQTHPFYYDTVWDLWKTVDYLQSRPDVDPIAIGMIGFSMGGIQTWLAASVDERVRVAVPAIAVQSFRWSLENEQWQGRAKTIAIVHEAAAKDLGEPKVNSGVCRALWSKLIPGILDRFDCPSLLRLFAGRPLLIVNGELDPNCPIGGAEVAFAAAREAYARAGASDRLKIDVAQGIGHAVTPEQRRMALDWLARWLKPTD